jgi:Rv2525c-like, glycoside hydrolase-like domain
MFGWSRLCRAGVAGAVAAVALGMTAPALGVTAPALGVTAAALAGPATTVSYPAWASATRFSGYAFDTCSAPSAAAMRAWVASPYTGVGVYVGGVNRTCAQPHLTRSWVGVVAHLGWALIPVYKGLQAPCGGKPTDQKIAPSLAAPEGTAEARQASADVRALGMIKGSAIYFDMEAYRAGHAACRSAVLNFLSAWTQELHRLGYVAGVYENLNLGARDLAGVYTSASYARPGALWIARYDGNSALTGWAGIAGRLWASHQRAKQYRADVRQTWGGVTLTVDADNVDAPVATIPDSYLVASGPVAARRGPGDSYRMVKVYPAGARVTVVCQAAGVTVHRTRVWDKLTDSTYIPGYYLSTPVRTGYGPPVTRCRYPYQVTAGGGAIVRSGPGVAYKVTGQLPDGSLAWVACQRAGAKVGSTTTWDQISYQRWVSDNYVATPGATGYRGPAPRC